MAVRLVLGLAAVGVALLGAAWWYANRDGPPACESDQALHGVTVILRDQFQLDGVFVNNIRTVTGGWFSDQRDCSAEVAVIRGNVNASDMAWRGIQFHIGSDAAVSVRLGGDVPLAKPGLSWWERLLAHL